MITIGNPYPGNFIMRAVRYSRALTRWIKSGRPVRSEEEILEIFTTHCRECESMDRELGRCGECGCHVGLVPAPLVNKIAMATEHCPDNRW